MAFRIRSHHWRSIRTLCMHMQVGNYQGRQFFVEPMRIDVGRPLVDFASMPLCGVALLPHARW